MRVEVELGGGRRPPCSASARLGLLEEGVVVVIVRAGIDAPTLCAAPFHTRIGADPVVVELGVECA